MAICFLNEIVKTLCAVKQRESEDNVNLGCKMQTYHIESRCMANWERSQATFNSYLDSLML